MMKPYKYSLKLFLVFLGISLFSQSFAQQDDSTNNDRWNSVKRAIFTDSLIQEGQGVISIEAPKRAYDSAIVPIKISIQLPDDTHFVEQLYIIVDNNPAPLAATFNFNTEQSKLEIQTRLRINEYTNVRAVVKTDNNQYFMNHAFVKAAGGCSAPMLSDLDAALARLGEMKFRVLDSTSESSGQSIGHLLISHPNNSGMQFDQISRNYIPANYLQNVTVKLNHRELFALDANFSLSENPSIHFSFDGDSDSDGIISVNAVDSNNNQYEKSWAVNDDT